MSSIDIYKELEVLQSFVNDRGGKNQIKAFHYVNEKLRDLLHKEKKEKKKKK